MRLGGCLKPSRFFFALRSNLCVVADFLFAIFRSYGVNGTGENTATQSGELRQQNTRGHTKRALSSRLRQPDVIIFFNHPEAHNSTARQPTSTLQ